MELHNAIKGTVVSKVEEIFEALENGNNPNNFCTCDQCRMDVTCYVLNRTQPRYIVSGRGASKSIEAGIGQQQQTADITALIHEALKRVNHNLRPNFAHSNEKNTNPDEATIPKFNIPTIIGRVFNGNNFAPISDASVELLWSEGPVAMKNGNWQNPYSIIHDIEGSFSFWPAPVEADKAGKHKIFEYIVRVSAPEFETLTHTFKIPVASEVQTSLSFNPDRTFKLPDLYMFAPGEAEKNGYLDG